MQKDAVEEEAASGCEAATIQLSGRRREVQTYRDAIPHISRLGGDGRLAPRVRQRDPTTPLSLASDAGPRPSQAALAQRHTTGGKGLDGRCARCYAWLPLHVTPKAHELACESCGVVAKPLFNDGPEYNVKIDDEDENARGRIRGEAHDDEQQHEEQTIKDGVFKEEKKRWAQTRLNQVLLLATKVGPDAPMGSRLLDESDIKWITMQTKLAAEKHASEVVYMAGEEPPSASASFWAIALIRAAVARRNRSGGGFWTVPDGDTQRALDMDRLHAHLANFESEEHRTMEVLPFATCGGMKTAQLMAETVKVRALRIDTLGDDVQRRRKLRYLQTLLLSARAEALPKEVVNMTQPAVRATLVAPARVGRARARLAKRVESWAKDREGKEASNGFGPPKLPSIKTLSELPRTGLYAEKEVVVVLRKRSRQEEDASNALPPAKQTAPSPPPSKQEALEEADWEEYFEDAPNNEKPPEQTAPEEDDWEQYFPHSPHDEQPDAEDASDDEQPDDDSGKRRHRPQSPLKEDDDNAPASLTSAGINLKKKEPHAVSLRTFLYSSASFAADALRQRRQAIALNELETHQKKLAALTKEEEKCRKRHEVATRKKEAAENVLVRQFGHMTTAEVPAMNVAPMRKTKVSAADEKEDRKIRFTGFRFKWSEPPASAGEGPNVVNRVLRPRR